MTATVPTETMGSTHHERRKIFIPRRTPGDLGVVTTLADKITAGDAVIPRPSLTALKPLVEQWRALHASIDELEARLVARAGSDERMRRLMQIPGVGPAHCACGGHRDRRSDTLQHRG